MNNQVIQPASPIAPVPQPQAQPSSNAITQDIQRAKGLVEKIREGIKQKQEMAKTRQGIPGAPKQKLIDKKIMILLVGLAVLVVLLIAGTLYKAMSGRGQRIVLAPTPTPVVTPTLAPVEIRNPSRYATDSGVLKIEEDLKALDKDLVGTEIKESSLTPPSLDWDVSFKE